MQYAREHHFPNPTFFVDDGVSGVTYDRPGVQAQEEWVEQVPIQKYIRYTAEELAAQEEARKKQEAREKLPETVAALQEENKTLKKESKMLKQCLLEMSEIVYA